MIKGRRARKCRRVTLGRPIRKMGRAGDWGLPMRSARMLDRVQDAHTLHG